MSDEGKNGAFWSAAGPHSEKWRRMGIETRDRFNQSARGETGADKKETPDKARLEHDLEPSLQEKKEGAAMDKGAAHKLFDSYKAQARERSRNHDLGR